MTLARMQLTSYLGKAKREGDSNNDHQALGLCEGCTVCSHCWSEKKDFGLEKELG
jgi:hypothetical protein